MPFYTALLPEDISFAQSKYFPYSLLAVLKECKKLRILKISNLTFLMLSTIITCTCEINLITCIAKHLILDNNLVCVQCLSEHFVSMVLIGQIEQHLPKT